VLLLLLLLLLICRESSTIQQQHKNQSRRSVKASPTNTQHPRDLVIRAGLLCGGVAASISKQAQSDDAIADDHTNETHGIDSAESRCDIEPSPSTSGESEQLLPTRTS